MCVATCILFNRARAAAHPGCGQLTPACRGDLCSAASAGEIDVVDGTIKQSNSLELRT